MPMARFSLPESQLKLWVQQAHSVLLVPGDRHPAKQYDLVSKALCLPLGHRGDNQGGGDAF